MAACDLDGFVTITSCELEGTAVITVPPATTTTLCQRPSGLNLSYFIYGYTVGASPEIITNTSLTDAENGISFLSGSGGDSSIKASLICINYESLEVGSTVYADCNLTDCTLVDDGWYFTDQSMWSTKLIYYVEGGTILSITQQYCGTTTSTTTLPPDIPECCGILLGTSTNVNYLNFKSTTSSISQIIDVPQYINAVPYLGMANTTSKLFVINNDKISSWDITLSPFSATESDFITLPGGTIVSGIIAINNTTLIGYDSSIGQVVEITILGTSSTQVTKFSLETNRIAVGTPLYTTTDKFITINQDTVTSDYYISQYNYDTGTLEVDINITTSVPTPIALYECNCNIYIINTIGEMYVLDIVNPYPIAYIASLGYNVDVASQVQSCVITNLL
jgi:hypothetical protein